MVSEMAIYEILNLDGEVENRIVADADFVEEHYSGRYRLLPDPEPVQSISDIPTITRFQAKAALLNAGLLEQVDAAVAASDDPLVKLAWSEAQTFERISPAILAITDDLGMAPQEVNDLFIAAKKISV